MCSESHVEYSAQTMSHQSLASESSSQTLHFQVEDRQKRIQREPSGYKFPVNEWPNPLKSRLLLKTLPSTTQLRSVSLLPKVDSMSTATKSRNEARDSKKALHDLVSKRSVQSEVIDFLVQCQSHYSRERDLSFPGERQDMKHVIDCLHSISDIPVTFDDSDKSTKSRRNEMIQEVIRSPELYQLLTEMILESRFAYERSESPVLDSSLAENNQISSDLHTVPISGTVDEDIMRYLHSR